MKRTDAVVCVQISLYQCRDSLYLALGFIIIYSQSPQSTPLSYFFMLFLTVKVALLSNVSIFCPKELFLGKYTWTELDPT